MCLIMSVYVLLVKEHAVNSLLIFFKSLKTCPLQKRKNCLLLTNNVKPKYILGVKLRKSYKPQALPLMLVNVAMMRILRRMMATAMVSTSDAWVKGSRLWWGWASVVRAHRHCCYLSHITA